MIYHAHQRPLNTAIGGDANSVYLVVNSIGTLAGQGFDFINGMTFLERFYSVFGKMTIYNASSRFDHAPQILPIKESVLPRLRLPRPT